MYSAPAHILHSTELLQFAGDKMAWLQEEHNPFEFFRSSTGLHIWSPEFEQQILPRARIIRAAPPIRYRMYDLKKGAYHREIQERLPATYAFVPEDVWFLASLIGEQRTGSHGPLLTTNGIGNVFFVEVTPSRILHVGIYMWQGQMRIGCLGLNDEPVQEGRRIFAKLG